MSSKEDFNKGKQEFEDRFTDQLMKNHNLDVTSIEWDIWEQGIHKFAAIIKGKRILLETKYGEIEDFGAGGPEEFRIDLLNRKEQEFLEKYYKK